ncbi:MAG: insulinase family protein [Lachnospiraceae bacterium]|nr:insulinase family protein [Lachnospiraceae bacterium]
MMDLSGFTCDGYERVEHRELKDLHADGLVLRHKKSGARIVLLSNDDPNKVFAIAFRTTPVNSTGVPHIIEHSVLAGSEKYPVKDPFMEMEKGSLKTFINAFTAADWTMYPCASCNDKDFRNLIDVYMDAVMHPLIYKRKEIFLQEGWRYEMESPESDLTINGVVYSEMKGAYSDPERALDFELRKALFPDTTYGVESGGDPKDIPNLSYEEFLEFHRTYYSPANSYIYLYGDMDMQDTLAYLDREYLSGFDIIPVNSEVGVQKPVGFKKVTFPYSVPEGSDTADKCYLEYGVKLFDGPDVKQALAWEILASILFSIPGAPVKKALVDAGIGKDVSGYLAGDQRQPALMVTARETEAEKADEFLRIIRETTASIVRDGVNKRSIEAALNRAEFSYREADFGGYPKGIIFGFTSLSGYLYDENAPFDGLDKSWVFDELREDLKNGYFEKLLQGFLDSDHAALVVMTPEPGLGTKEEQALADALAKKKAAMSEAEIAELVEATKALKAYQSRVETPEELACIPMLSREDIGKEPLPVPYTVEKTEAGIPLIHVDRFSGGISYLQMRFDATDVSEEDLPYLGLLSDVYMFMDTKNYSYRELQDEANFYTGGISGFLDSTAARGEIGEMRSCFNIAVKAFDGGLTKGVELAWEGIGRLDFSDTDRLREILAELSVKLPASMEGRGHTTARSLAFSYFSPSARFTYLSCGESYYAKVREWLADYDNVKDEIVAHLAKVRAHIFTKDRLTFGITADADGFAKAADAFAAMPQYLAEIAGDEAITGLTEAPWKGGYRFEKKNEILTYAGAVQYNAVAGNYRRAGYTYSGACAVPDTILSRDYLWNKIRVLGGAYGAMEGTGVISGDVFMVTYRDPNCRESYKTFDGVTDYIKSLSLTEKEITKYIIGTIADMDIPYTPSSILGTAMNRYFSGLTGEYWQQVRTQVLTVTNEQLTALAPMFEAVLAQGYRAALATESTAKECADLFGESRGLRG